jgi:TPR repeat protein
MERIFTIWNRAVGCAVQVPAPAEVLSEFILFLLEVDLLSRYTDSQHERALAETLHWMKKRPVGREEEYEYAEYQYRLKDYRKAVLWYGKSAEKDYVPALYRLAYCMRNNMGTVSDLELENFYFRKVVEKDMKLPDKEAGYRLGMCHLYGYGVKKDEDLGLFYLESVKDSNMEALYEIGIAYRDGKGSYKKDIHMAEKCFMKAYGGFCEEAIFAAFDMFHGEFDEFPYKRDIKEAYSFKLGRLVRAAELIPCREYLLRLADFYRRGYPGDSESGRRNFLKLAKKYYERAGEVKC